MTQILLDYLKELVTLHPDFKHDERNNIAYFEFDYVSMMGERRRADAVLFVDKITGAYDDNDGDYHTDVQLIQFRLIEKLDSKNITDTIGAFLRSKQRGEEMISKMRHDHKNPDDIPGDMDFQDNVCKLLKHVYLENVTYEQVQLNEDGWSGVLFRLPFRSEIQTTYNPELWQ